MESIYLGRSYDELVENGFTCPVCGSRMIYDGGLVPWQCEGCWREADVEVNEKTGDCYLIMPDELSEAEALADPVSNMPECCKGCGGPFPACMTSCKIFDK